MFERVGLILLAPDERHSLLQPGEAHAYVRVEIAGEKSRYGVLRTRLVAGRVVLRDEAIGRAASVVEEFLARVVAYASLAGDDVVKGCAEHGRLQQAVEG